MLERQLHLDLPLHLVDKIAFDHGQFLHCLQRIDVAATFPPDPANDTEGTLAERPARIAIQHLKVIQVY
jgi:hypothetical protein